MSQFRCSLLLVASVFLVGCVEQPPAPTSTAVMDTELGLPLGAPLLSVFAVSPPVMDGSVEAVWQQAPLLAAPLHYGLHGVEPAGTLELRSLYDDGRVYFLARWPASVPGGEPDAWRNLLTVHWRLADPDLVSGQASGSDGLACTVACHTATADGQGHLAGMRIETIPPGLDVDLPFAGGWSEGMWTLEWSRQRPSDSPYDQPMTDRTQGYRFFVKLFQGVEGHADPVSDLHELWLSR